MGEVGAVRDIADRCVTLAEDLLARQKNLLADIRKMNVAPVGTADDEDDEFGKESTELLGGEKKEQQKEELKKSVRNKINIDEAASQNELEDEEISAAFRISIKRMEWMDEETLKESFKQCIGDDDKEAIVLKHVIAERKRIAAEKEIVDNKNIVKKRHDRENRKNGLMDIILKKRRQVEKKEAEDQRVAGALRILLDQRLAEQETESRLRAKKNKKAGKQKQAQVSDAADVDKLDLITGLGLRDNRVIGKPSGNVPGSRPYHVQSGTSGSKREFFEFIESVPTE
jgi:hypothetical protein